MFELIAGAPESEHYWCLHSLGLQRHPTKPFAECDFVVVGPMGVFVLEVKGGEIHRDESGWRIGWPNANYLSREGPFKQAQSASQALMQEYGRRTSEAERRRVLFAHGVVFPDIRFDQRDPEWDPRIVCDSRDMKGSFLRYVERLATFHRENLSRLGLSFDFLTDGQVRSVVAAFRRDFDVVPLLGDLLRASERELVCLSANQYRVLDYTLNPNNRRVLCCGPAGSGKTLVAVEAARRLARDGLRVLFVCYNKLLGGFARRELGATGANVTVSTVTAFLLDKMNRAGLSHELSQKRASSADPRNFFGQLPALFERAVEALIEQGEFAFFDCLVVDEGQDVLARETIDALSLVLQDGIRAGRWCIFLDDEMQSGVFKRMNRSVLSTLRGTGAFNVTLDENFRNPPAVVSEVTALTGAKQPTCRRTLHSPIEYVVYSSPSMQGKKLRRVLARVVSEGVPRDAITILSAKSSAESCAVRYPPRDFDVNSIDRYDSHRVAGIRSCSISAFKGLENEVIILTDLPVPVAGDEWVRSLLYVGMTRARTRVVALICEEFLEFCERH